MALTDGKGTTIEVKSTTKDIKEVTLPDTEYVHYLVMKELVIAIQDLTKAIRRSQ